MAAKRETYVPSSRAGQAIASFAKLAMALDRGKLAEASDQQSRLRGLGFNLELRPLAPSPHRDETAGAV